MFNHYYPLMGKQSLQLFHLLIWHEIFFLMIVIQDEEKRESMYKQYNILIEDLCIVFVLCARLMFHAKLIFNRIFERKSNRALIWDVLRASRWAAATCDLMKGKFYFSQF